MTPQSGKLPNNAAANTGQKPGRIGSLWKSRGNWSKRKYLSDLQEMLQKGRVEKANIRNGELAENNGFRIKEDFEVWRP